MRAWLITARGKSLFRERLFALPGTAGVAAKRPLLGLSRAALPRQSALAMSVCEAALLVACGTMAATRWGLFVKARRRSRRPPGVSPDRGPARGSSNERAAEAALSLLSPLDPHPTSVGTRLQLRQQLDETVDGSSACRG